MKKRNTELGMGEKMMWMNNFFGFVYIRTIIAVAPRLRRYESIFRKISKEKK